MGQQLGNVVACETGIDDDQAPNIVERNAVGLLRHRSGTRARFITGLAAKVVVEHRRSMLERIVAQQFDDTIKPHVMGRDAEGCHGASVLDRPTIATRDGHAAISLEVGDLVSAHLGLSSVRVVAIDRL
jgi:hypothetical protein